MQTRPCYYVFAHLSSACDPVYLVIRVLYNGGVRGFDPTSGPTTRSRRGPGEAAARQPLTHLVTGTGGGKHVGRRDQKALCKHPARRTMLVKGEQK